MAYRTSLPGGGVPQSNDTSRAGAAVGAATGKFGDAAKVGAAGERYFAEMLRREAIDSIADVFYGLSIPRGRSKAYQSTGARQADVDVALVNGNTLVLVDVKRWKGNSVYWTLGGLPFRDFMPLMHRGEWKLSANMATAVRKYREEFPGVNVSAMVVFVPTQKGNAPASVSLFKWPGGIRSYLMPAGMKELRRRLGDQRKVPQALLIGRLHALQKK